MQHNSTSYPTFTSNLDRLARSKGFRDVFTDLLDFSIFCLTVKDDAKLTRNPVSDYKGAEQQLFIDTFKLMGDLLEDYTDAFGDVFMEYLSYGKNGQFFTPQPICDMMAKITIGDSIEDGKSVCDCACGSGRTLLAAAKINRNLQFIGSDIDLTCVKMAVVNLAYNSLQGEIAWMNTLSMEHYASFQVRIEPFTKFPYIVVTGKNESIQLPKLKNAIESMPVHQKQQVATQTNLFD
jgi:type I restriction-modification system DNA methylase subunit